MGKLAVSGLGKSRSSTSSHGVDLPELLGRQQKFSHFTLSAVSLYIGRTFCSVSNYKAIKRADNAYRMQSDRQPFATSMDKNRRVSYI